MNCETGELLAIKTVPMREGVDAGTVESELSLLQQLRHPNVVRYITSRAEEDGAGHMLMNIVMEYVPGGSLLQLINKFGKFHENVVRGYVEQGLKGLQFLHDHLVVHRDIKAANILVSDAGVVKLSDFGSALSLNSAPAAPPGLPRAGGSSPEPGAAPNAKTRPLIIGGTPQWTAPEVIKENKLSAKSDVWSFGCVVIEMCTGKMPWAEKGFENAFTTLYHIGQGREAPRFPEPPAVSLLLHSFMADCLQVDPRDRPSAQVLRRHGFMTQSRSVLRKSLPGGVYRTESTAERTPAKRRKLNNGASLAQPNAAGGGALFCCDISTYHPTMSSLSPPDGDSDLDMAEGATMDPAHVHYLEEQAKAAPTLCRPTGLTAAFADLAPYGPTAASHNKEGATPEPRERCAA
eukprot:TRINITY_DN10469_c0_g1_i2.p1 TRINITY_DN10469_c0_g1~~TRINITY_DN10469_c0_g1_i2.p1  ORF type:complete len:405 (+),score=101.25 TRINITY_DN10469_c0_g1_i2:276-1490(+)